MVEETGRSVHISYSNPPREHHRKIASLIQKYTPQGRVLDVGCGLGHTLAYLRQLNPRLQLFGADIDENCLRITRERVPEVTAMRMQDKGFSAEGLGEGYDTCTMGHVLEHTLHPLSAIEVLLSLLKPGGHLILATPNPVRPHVIIHSLLRRHYVNRGHVHAWDRSHWINFLENIAALDVLEYPVDEVRVFPSRLKRRARPLQAMEVWMAKVVPWWSFSNIAVIRKPPGAEAPPA